MSPTIRDKYKYFHSTVQRVKDRRQKFHFCRLPFDVRPRNVKLNLFIDVMFQEVYSKTQEEDSSTMQPYESILLNMHILQNIVNGLVNWLFMKEHTGNHLFVMASWFGFHLNGVPVALKEVNEEFHTPLCTVSAIWWTYTSS